MNETKFSERLKSMSDITKDITRRHHEELRDKDKIISELREALRIVNLKLIKSECNTKRAETYKKSAEIALERYKAKTIYFAKKILEYRRSRNRG